MVFKQYFLFAEHKSLVSLIMLHPKYNPTIFGPFDIALTKPAIPFIYNLAIQPIKLPQRFVHPSGKVIISGWGSNSTSNEAIMPDTIQYAVVPILPFLQCAELLSETHFGATNFCTGPLEGGVGTCSGDSGGGVVQFNGLNQVNYFKIKCKSIIRN